MSFYMGEKIYNEMNIDEQALPTIEYGAAPSGSGTGPQPFELNDKIKFLGHIFNKD